MKIVQTCKLQEKWTVAIWGFAIREDINNSKINKDNYGNIITEIRS